MGFALTVAPVFCPISNEFYIKVDTCRKFAKKVARLICSKVKGKLIFRKFMNEVKGTNLKLISFHC